LAVSKKLIPQFQRVPDDRPAICLVEHPFVHPLCRIAEAHAAEADAHHRAADIDDAPVVLRQHGGEKGAHAVKHAVDVDIEGAPPICGGCRPHRAIASARSTPKRAASCASLSPRRASSDYDQVLKSHVAPLVVRGATFWEGFGIGRRQFGRRCGL